MVSKCIGLWSSKIKQEYETYLRKAVKEVECKIQELQANCKGKKLISISDRNHRIMSNLIPDLTSQLKEFERKDADIKAIYNKVHNSITSKEHSKVWKALGKSYDDDIKVGETKIAMIPAYNNIITYPSTV
jgi:hypothetical protein